MVLVLLPNVAHYTWPLARILQLYPDDKGVVRSAKIKCNNQEYLRPVCQFVPLEMDEERAGDGTEEKKEEAAVDAPAGPVLSHPGEEGAEALSNT